MKVDGKKVKWRKIGYMEKMPVIKETISKEDIIKLAREIYNGQLTEYAGYKKDYIFIDTPAYRRNGVKVRYRYMIVSDEILKEAYNVVKYTTAMRFVIDNNSSIRYILSRYGNQVTVLHEVDYNSANITIYIPGRIALKLIKENPRIFVDAATMYRVKDKAFINISIVIYSSSKKIITEIYERFKKYARSSWVSSIEEPEPNYYIRIFSQRTVDVRPKDKKIEKKENKKEEGYKPFLEPIYDPFKIEGEIKATIVKVKLRKKKREQKMNKNVHEHRCSDPNLALQTHYHFPVIILHLPRPRPPVIYEAIRLLSPPPQETLIFSFPFKGPPCRDNLTMLPLPLDVTVSL